MGQPLRPLNPSILVATVRSVEPKRVDQFNDWKMETEERWYYEIEVSIRKCTTLRNTEIPGSIDPVFLEDMKPTTPKFKKGDVRRFLISQDDKVKEGDAVRIETPQHDQVETVSIRILNKADLKAELKKTWGK